MAVSVEPQRLCSAYHRQMQEALAEDGSWLYTVRLRHIVALSDRISGIDDPQPEPHTHGLLREWVERVGLAGDLIKRYPHEVSEGQLQRACLARALVLEPGYLICDEPSSMLDVSTQAALLEAISAEQNKRDLGVLLITYDRILADHWCEGTIEPNKPEERR